jgi:hypothetical protein
VNTLPGQRIPQWRQSRWRPLRPQRAAIVWRISASNTAVGADAYRGAERIAVAHASLSAGDPCPTCGQGTVYEKAPGVVVRISGQPPLAAMIYQLQKLRCHLCGQVFTAAAPPEAGNGKYDANLRRLERIVAHIDAFFLESADRARLMPTAEVELRIIILAGPLQPPIPGSGTPSPRNRRRAIFVRV